MTEDVGRDFNSVMLSCFRPLMEMKCSRFIMARIKSEVKRNFFTADPRLARFQSWCIPLLFTGAKSPKVY